MTKRKIAPNPEEVKRLKKELKNAKNSIESKRIMIMITYLWWKGMNQTSKILSTSSDTVKKTISRYIENKYDFYKTNYTWRKTSEKSKKIMNELNKLVEEKINKWEYVDIKDIEKEYNRKNKEKLSYFKVWWYLRERLWYNYQKPYIKDKRQPENAEEIAKWRLTKEIIRIWIEEKEIDAYAIKNKKNIFWENITKNVNIL